MSHRGRYWTPIRSIYLGAGASDLGYSRPGRRERSGKAETGWGMSPEHWNRGGGEGLTFPGNVSSHIVHPWLKALSILPKPYIWKIESQGETFPLWYLLSHSFLEV